MTTNTENASISDSSSMSVTQNLRITNAANNLKEAANRILILAIQGKEAFGSRIAIDREDLNELISECQVILDVLVEEKSP